MRLKIHILLMILLMILTVVGTANGDLPTEIKYTFINKAGRDVDDLHIVYSANIEGNPVISVPTVNTLIDQNRLNIVFKNALPQNGEVTITAYSTKIDTIVNNYQWSYQDVVNGNKVDVLIGQTINVVTRSIKTKDDGISFDYNEKIANINDVIVPNLINIKQLDDPNNNKDNTKVTFKGKLDKKEPGQITAKIFYNNNQNIEDLIINISPHHRLDLL